MFLKVCLFASTVFFCSIAYMLVAQLDITKSYEIKDSGCELVDGPRGFEDQTHWNKDVLISTQRDMAWLVKKDRTLKKDGGMYVITGFDGSHKDVTIKKLDIKNWPEGLEFQPHGMDIEDSERRAYVVNHAHGSERIEVFDVNVDSNDTPQDLTYLYSIKSDELNEKAYEAINSVAVVAPNKVYATQWMEARPLDQQVENPLSLAKVFRRFTAAYPVYFLEYDPSSSTLKMEIASLDLRAPNGITRNPNSTQIYVADCFKKQIGVFKRNPETNELTKTEMISSVHSNDNIKYDRQSNTLYTGSIQYTWGALLAIKSFPKNSKHGVGGLTEYGHDAATNSWWIKDHVVTSMFNGISNSIRVGNTLIGGSFRDKGILVCKGDGKTEKKQVSLSYQTNEL